jgi:hypothetical protein
MNEPTIEANLEVLPPSSLEALERASIDVQIATARKYERSLKKFQTRALEMATLDFETSESCIYSRPVGKEKNAAGEWVQKFAEGASIRMAEIVAACYGNIRVGARIIEQTERYVTCEGYAHDLESNYAAKSEVREATIKKDGTPYDERMRAVIAKATLSKAFRDAVFKVVPKALCKTVIDEAKKVVIGDSTTLEDRRKKAAEWVKNKSIDEARVFGALGVKGWTEVGLEQLAVLTGLRTSIKDGEVTADEAFPPVAKAPENLGAETAPTPALFAAGEGQKTPAAKKKAAPQPDAKVTELRKLIAEAKLTEAIIVTALHESGVDETLTTLDDIQKINPKAIEHAVANFDEVKPK